MNGLSWILYLADVSNSTRVVAIGLTAVAVLAVAVSAFIYVVNLEDSDEESRAKAGSFVRNICKRFLPLAIVAYAVFAFLPTQRTLMLIAASEIGEDVLSTATAQNIGGEAGELATDSLRLLRKYVSEQLGETEVSKD